MASRTRLPPRWGQAEAWGPGPIDLVRALALGEIRVVVVAERHDPARWSRSAVAHLDVAPDLEAEARADALLALAADRPEPPVLYYDDDADLLLVSRHRDRLARAFRFVIPAAELVEDLVDKARFHPLAERLRVPRARPPARPRGG